MLLVLGFETDAAPSIFPRRIAMLGASRDDIWEGMVAALRALYLAGMDINWQVFWRTSKERPRRKLDLPTYAFQRQHFWRPKVPVVEAAPLPTREASIGAIWFRRSPSKEAQVRFVGIPRIMRSAGAGSKT